MDLSFLSYFDLLFYIVLGLAVLMGFARGLKKTLFTLITMAIFYVAFFLTVGPVSRLLWTMDMPWLGPILANVDASLATFTSFEDSLSAFLQIGLGDAIDVANVSEELLELATGLGIFVLKIVYTLLYFTVILVLYKIICMILAAIIIGKAGKGESKNHGLGAVVGIANGVMAVFVMLIMFGGIMSITESLVTLLPADGSEETEPLVFVPRSDLIQLHQSLIPLAEPEEDPGLSDEMLTMLEEVAAMVEAYNNNLLVQLAGNITTASIVNADETVPLHLNLFDTVLSFEYNEQVVAFRFELGILSEVALIFLESEYMTTSNIADITGAEIRAMFAALGKSNLIISLMPLAIELAAENFGQDLPISKDDLYAIDFAEELPKIGAIVGALFDILNDAGVIAGDGELQDIEITGEVVRDLFQSMSESQVILLLVEAVLVPMLESEDAGLGGVISIPADVDWEAELVAIGEVLAAIFDQDVSFQDLLGDDPLVFLKAVASIDVDLLLDSKLITSTLINILSGDTGLAGLDFLEIPEGIVWLDDDNLGELRNLLVAMQVLVNLVAEIDFENLSISTLAGMSDTEIDDLFGSYILVATISKLITDIDFRDTPILIPDNVFDDQGYILAAELKALAKAIALIIDEEAAETFDITKALSMDAADIDVFLASEIIAATIGKLIIDLDVDLLVVPDEVVTLIDVDDIPTTVVESDEIAALLKALALLEITDFSALAFDAGIIGKFAQTADPNAIDDDKIATFLDSKIIHGSVSAMIIDLGSGGSPLLAVPTLSVAGDPLITDVGSTEYLSETEITALFQALLVLDLADFDDINLEDTALLLDNLTVLLASAILHATISDQILGIDANVLTVPYVSGDDVPVAIRITQAETEYIATFELEAFFTAVDQLGFADPTAFEAEFSLADINEESEQDLLLASAIIHATISAKIIGFGDDILVVPALAADGTTVIRYETGDAGEETEFLLSEEIKALIRALDVLGITSLADFAGTLSLANLFASQLPDDYASNQNDFLASASIHATVSKQILGLGASVLIVPYENAAGDDIRTTVGLVEYVVAAEIKTIINAIDILTGGTLTSVDAFSGTFTLTNLATGANQDAVLASAAMHATISEQLFDVDDDILFVPATQQDGLTALMVESGPLGFEQTFVVKPEIKALIDALLIMGFTDLDSFASEFALSDDLFANPAAVFASSIMQAMFSDRLLNDTGTSLVIPNTYYVSGNPLVIAQADVTYIESAELIAFITALELLGLDDFATFSFTPTNIFLLASFDGLLASEIMQATISANILDAAKDETESPAATDLVVALFHRQTINVGLGTAVQIQKTELNRLLVSLKMLGLSAFGDALEPAAVTAIFDDADDRVIFTNSASIHVTLDNMIKHNPNISGSIPALARHDVIYNINNVTTKDEIIAFIRAADTLATAQSSGDDFTQISFSFAGLLALDQAQQSVILDSMIVRNKITPETEIFCAATPPIYNLIATDYELDDISTFLRKTTFEDIILHYE